MTGFLFEMTKNTQADVVQSRQPFFVRCGVAFKRMFFLTINEHSQQFAQVIVITLKKYHLKNRKAIGNQSLSLYHF